MARRSLGDIVRQMIITESERKDKCGLLALVHNTPSGPKEIQKIPITSAQPVNPDDVAEVFLGRAETHAQDLEGVQTYTVLAFFEGKSQPFTEQTFRAGGKSSEGYSLVSEPPNEKGMMTQHMRLLESCFKSALVHSETMLKNMAEHNEKLMEENADAMGIVREMLMKEAEQRFNRDKELREMDRSTEERKALLKLVPALTNTITGKEVFPQSTEDTALIEMLAEKITPDQIKMLSAMGFDPKLVGALHTRLLKAEKEREARKYRLEGGGNGSS